MNSKPLFELVSQANELSEKIVESGGEITPEMETALALNETAIATKVDSYAVLMDRSALEESYWRARAAECEAIARGFKKVAERLDNNIHQAMKAMSVTEITGDEYKFKIQKCGSRLVIEDKEALPKEYVIQTVVTEPDKARIKSALSEGFKVSGAKLEGGTTVKKIRNVKGK